MKESDPLPTDTAEDFTLIDEEIFHSRKVEFFLDMKVCNKVEFSIYI